MSEGTMCPATMNGIDGPLHCRMYVGHVGKHETRDPDLPFNGLFLWEGKPAPEPRCATCEGLRTDPIHRSAWRRGDLHGHTFAPAPEPRCATCGAVKDSSLWTNTCAVAVKPAPEPRCATCDGIYESDAHASYRRGEARGHPFKPAPEPSGRMGGEDFERLIEHDRYESMTRPNECKLIVEARRARASEDALREAIRDAREWITMIDGWKPRDMDATISALNQIDTKLAATLRGKP